MYPPTVLGARSPKSSDCQNRFLHEGSRRESVPTSPAGLWYVNTLWGGTPQDGIYLLKIVYLFLHVSTLATLKALSTWCNTPIEIFLPLLKTVKKKKILFIYFQREEWRKREKHPCAVASRTPPTGVLACNPGMSPDWESKQQPFGSQASAQSTEPHQPGLKTVWTCQFWCLSVLLPFFCLTSSILAKCLLWGLFSMGWGEENHWGWGPVNREGRAWSSCWFWSKTSEHSPWCVQVPHHEMGKHVKVFKKIHWSRTQPLTTMPTGTDGFLKHSPSRGSLHDKGPPL